MRDIHSRAAREQCSGRTQWAASLMRFSLVRAVLLLAAAAAPLSILAQDYPVRPIRFIVGFAPGGLADLLARSMGQKLTPALGQQVVVDNRAGGGGLISMQLAAEAAPDGYTLVLGSSTTFSINPVLRAVPYDPIRDFTPITRAALTPVILTVQPSFPARSLQELIKLAKKAKPDQLMNFASTGFGGATHIAAELLKRVAGIEMTHVPYKGGSLAVIDLIGGHVQMSFGAVSTSLPYLRAGKLRALGVTSAKRLAAIPDVPTFAESGLPGFEVEQWYGVFAPAGLPVAITRKLNAVLVPALASPEFKQQLSDQGIELVSSTPEEFAAYVKNQLANWTRMLTETGLRAAPLAR